MIKRNNTNKPTAATKEIEKAKYHQGQQQHDLFFFFSHSFSKPEAQSKTTHTNKQQERDICKGDSKVERRERQDTLPAAKGHPVVDEGSCDAILVVFEEEEEDTVEEEMSLPCEEEDELVVVVFEGSVGREGTFTAVVSFFAATMVGVEQ